MNKEKYHPSVLSEFDKLDINLRDLIDERVNWDVNGLFPLNEIICGGFDWASSFEGLDFWNNIALHCGNQEYSKASSYYYLNHPSSKSKPKVETIADFANVEGKFSAKVCSDAFINLDLGLWELIQSRVVSDVKHVKNLGEVVFRGFSWNNEEGGDFWNSIHNFLEKKDYTSANTEYLLRKGKKLKTPVSPEPVIDKKVGFTIKDGVIRFDGHEVRVGDIVSFDSYNLETDLHVVKQEVLKIERDGYGGNMPIYLSKSCWCNIHKASNFVNHGPKDSPVPVETGVSSIVSDYTLYASDSLTSTRFHIHDSGISQPKKDSKVSDYDQKPVTLYRPKTKLSLKPIKL